LECKVRGGRKRIEGSQKINEKRMHVVRSEVCYLILLFCEVMW
jgi:hypothetical protein